MSSRTPKSKKSTTKTPQVRHSPRISAKKPKEPDAVGKRKRNEAADEQLVLNETTPRTLLENVIKSHDTAQPSTRKRARVDQLSVAKAMVQRFSPRQHKLNQSAFGSSSATSSGNSSMIKSPKSPVRSSPNRSIRSRQATSLRKRATMKNFFLDNAGGPTPRTMIAGIIGAANEETPAVGTRLSRSGGQQIEDSDDSLEKTRNTSGLNLTKDSFLSGYPTIQSSDRLQMLRKRPTQRKPTVTADSFAADVRKQLTDEEFDIMNSTKKPDSTRSAKDFFKDISLIEPQKGSKRKSDEEPQDVEDGEIVEDQEEDIEEEQCDKNEGDKEEEEAEIEDQEEVEERAPAQEESVQEQGETPEEIAGDEQEQEEDENLEEDGNEDQEEQESQAADEESQDEDQEEEQAEDDEAPATGDEEEEVEEEGDIQEGKESIGVDRQRRDAQSSPKENLVQAEEGQEPEEDSAELDYDPADTLAPESRPRPSSSVEYDPLEPIPSVSAAPTPTNRRLTQLKITQLMHSPRGTMNTLMQMETESVNSSFRDLVHMKDNTGEEQPAKQAKPRGRPKGQAASHQREANKAKTPSMPTSLTKSIFQHFSKRHVNKQVMQEVEAITAKYWENVSSDLAAYANHAKRHMVVEKDMEMLMKRQGFINDQNSLNSLIENHLSLEHREELIPIARSGNVVERK